MEVEKAEEPAKKATKPEEAKKLLPTLPTLVSPTRPSMTGAPPTKVSTWYSFISFPFRNSPPAPCRCKPRPSSRSG